MEAGVETGHRGPVAERLSCGVDAREGPRLVQGASDVSRSIRARTSSSTTVASVNSPPPWTTRWPTASNSQPPATSSSTDASPSSQWSISCFSTTSSDSSRTLSFRLDDPALTTSTRPGAPPPLMTRATTSRAPPAWLTVLPHVPVVDGTLVDHLLPHDGGAGRESRHLVDDVHDEPCSGPCRS